MLIGPFTQLLTMEGLPSGGRILDEALTIVSNGGIRIREGLITEIGDFDELRGSSDEEVLETPTPSVALPGLIDAYTMICFAGARTHEYVLRLGGCTYEELAEQGGGILDTVRKTRAASPEELMSSLIGRAHLLLSSGVTTCEVKSGYGLTIEDEVKLLRVIGEADAHQPVTLLPSCLAAHVKPWEFSTNQEYLSFLIEELFPVLKKEKLTQRIDILVEDIAFSVEEARNYLQAAKDAGFSITVGGNMFSEGGARLGAEVGALSVSHLDNATVDEAAAMQQAHVAGIVLTNASLGLGRPYAPARMLLDSGITLAIASGWNPGTAPLGDLLIGAAVMGCAEKLTMAETLAGITSRAALALGMKDRGVLAPGMRADVTAFSCEEYQEILYHQGALKPSAVFIQGQCVLSR